MKTNLFASFLAAALLGAPVFSLNSPAAPAAQTLQAKESETEHRTKLEAQWKIQMSALVHNNRSQFESILNAASKKQPGKVNLALGLVNGVAKKFRLTEKDVRVEEVKFNATFTGAAVTASHKDASVPGGWRKFALPELWTFESGEWLRQL